MDGLNFIKQEALKSGACDRVRSIQTLEGIIKLFFSGPGREFGKTKHFPSLDHLRQYRGVYNQIPGVYIDAGEVPSFDTLSLIVGDTDATLRCNNPTYLYKTIVMHGAKVKLIARNYAVVTVTNIGGEVNVDSDDTCIISIEEK